MNKGRRAGKVKTIKLEIPRSSSRVSTELHLYSKMFYDERVKPLIDREVGDQKPSRNERLRIYNSCLAKAYLSETDDVKAKVQAALEDERKEKQVARQADKSIVDAVEKLSIDEILLYVFQSSIFYCNFNKFLSLVHNPLFPMLSKTSVMPWNSGPDGSLRS